MINIDIFKGQWSKNYVIDNSDKIFIFSDNDNRIGKGGLSIIRSLSNSKGIRVRKGPSKNNIAFYDDSEYEKNINNIIEDILEIKKIAFFYKKTLVFSNQGYGKNDDRLYQTAPRTFNFLNEQLRYHFGFDNITGSKWNMIPSTSDVINSHFIPINFAKKSIVMPINNDITLYKDISLSDLIINGEKISITSKTKYEPGDILTISTGDKNLVCLVCYSFDIIKVESKYWSLFEGFPKEFIESNLDVYDSDYKQTHFKYLCSVTKDGNLILKDQPFIDKCVLKENNDGYNFFTRIYRNKFRKSLDQILTDMDIKGNLVELDNEKVDGNLYYRLVNNEYTYYLRYSKNLFKNNLKILLVLKN